MGDGPGSTVCCGHAKTDEPPFAMLVPAPPFAPLGPVPWVAPGSSAASPIVPLHAETQTDIHAPKPTPATRKARFLIVRLNLCEVTVIIRVSGLLSTSLVSGGRQRPGSYLFLKGHGAMQHTPQSYAFKIVRPEHAKSPHVFPPWLPQLGKQTPPTSIESGG